MTLVNPDRVLNIILLPVSDSDEVIYVANLDEIVREYDSLEGLQVYHYHSVTDRIATLERIAQGAESYAAKYEPSIPVPDYSKEKNKYWALIGVSILFPDKLLNILGVGKAGGQVLGKLTGIGAGVGGATGLVVGSLAGPQGALVGGGLGAVAGAALGRLSPAIFGGSKISRYRKEETNAVKTNERNQLYQKRIADIANQIRYQTVASYFEVLPDFIDDGIGYYLADPHSIFVDPSKGDSPGWVYEAFDKAMHDSSLVSKMLYNLQRYYWRKIELNRNE